MKLLIFLVIVVLLYLNWSRIQAWLALKLLQRVQRSFEQAAGQRQAGRQQTRAGHATGEAGASSDPQRSQKQQLDDIEARKFTRPSQDEYVDFEELPK